MLTDCEITNFPYTRMLSSNRLAGTDNLKQSEKLLLIVKSWNFAHDLDDNKCFTVKEDRSCKRASETCRVTFVFFYIAHIIRMVQLRYKGNI